MTELSDLHDEIADAKHVGETPIINLTDISVERLIHMLVEAETSASIWRQVKQTLSQHLADQLQGKKIRWGQTLYRSRRQTVRSIPAEVRTDFAEWVAEGGSERIAKLFNPNQVRYGQLRDMETVDTDTGEIMSAFHTFVDEATGDDAPWTLEALPASRWPAYAEGMPEGEIR